MTVQGKIVIRTEPEQKERQASVRQNVSEATPKAKHQVQRRLLLDVVVRQSPAILKLLACEDEPLLVWRDAFLVLDLGLHVVNGVRGLHVKRDRLAREGLDEDLHAAPQTQHQVQRRLLLDVVVRQSPAILKLLACEDEP